MPFFLLFVGVLGFFMQTEQVRAQLTTVLREVLPVPTDRRLVDELASGRAFSLGIGALGSLWSVSAIYAALDRAMQGVFGRDRSRGFLGERLRAFGFVALLGVLAVLSFLFSVIGQDLESLLPPLAARTVTRGVELSAVSILLGLFAGFVVFFAVYRTVPRRRLPVSAVFVAALVASVCWEAAKIGFAILSREIGAFRAYGALALAAGLLTWIYLSAIIVLVGAELMKAWLARREPAGKTDGSVA